MLWVGPFTTATSAMVHANLNWTFGPFKYVFASPVFHRWHHTAADRGGSSNFAGTFPIWDLMFGTFYMPENELPDAYGIDDKQFPEGFPGQMLYPFPASHRRLRRCSTRAPAGRPLHFIHLFAVNLRPRSPPAIVMAGIVAVRSVGECNVGRVRASQGRCFGRDAIGIRDRRRACRDLHGQCRQAQIMKLPDKVATIVIGNPLIADATLQTGGILVVTGKGYGSTNLLALDRGGKIVMDTTIEVVGAAGANLVVVYKGVARESYSCTPECAPRITLGDDSKFFGDTLTQSGSRTGQAQSAAPSK